MKRFLSLLLVFLLALGVFASCGKKNGEQGGGTTGAQTTGGTQGAETTQPQSPEEAGRQLSFALNSTDGTYTVVGIGSCNSSKIIIPVVHEGKPVTRIGNQAFRQCNVIKEIVIPDSIQVIGKMSFYQCKGLTTLTIPGSVTEIGMMAFYGCENLKTVTLEAGVTQIGLSAFEHCLRLASVTIPDSVTKVGACAFRECQSLTALTLPGSVTAIENATFEDCIRLKSFTIPAGVLSIGDGAFRGCEALQSVVVPKSVMRLGVGVWEACTSLRFFTVEEGNGVYYDDRQCIIERAGKTVVAGCTISVIPNDGSVTGIGKRAFAGHLGVTEFTLPTAVTKIEEGAFDGCNGLVKLFYDGTIEQWYQITKGDGWNTHTGSYIVYCSNGNVAKG